MNTPKVKSMKLTPREVKISETAYGAGRLSAQAQIAILQDENEKLSRQIATMIAEEDFPPDFQD